MKITKKVYEKAHNLKKLAKLPDRTNAIRKPLLGKKILILTILSRKENYFLGQFFFVEINIALTKLEKNFDGNPIKDT